MESWLALGACPQQQFELESGVHFKRHFPLTTTFSSLVCIPAHNTKLDNFQDHKLHRTNGHTVHRPGMSSPAARRPNVQHGGDGQPAQSLPQTASGCSESHALHGVTGCFWAPASLDLHLTLSLKVSLVPMSAADIKLGGAVGFLVGKGTSR